MLKTWIGDASRNTWRALAWSALLAGALLLTWLFQAVATAATERAVQAETAPIHTLPASLTFANSDDARRFTADRGPDANCEIVVAQPLYVGQNTWVPQTQWQCADVLP